MVNWPELENEIIKCNSLSELEEKRVSILGKNGTLTKKLKQLGTLSFEEKRTHGEQLNEWRNRLNRAIQEKRKELEFLNLNRRLVNETLDVTLPIRPETEGSIHIISSTIYRIKQYFNRLGFDTVEGPEIEDEFHNFDVLNIPYHHPARQSHDTFYFNNFPHMLLRTHTSPVQIRALKKRLPPLRILVPGKVYRSDSLDSTHTPMFHQIEGLVIGEDINFKHLKGCIINFCRWFFEKNKLPVRFRPSFFPFTEPSAEVDIGCQKTNSQLTIGEGESWMEILGCGMVHPNVLKVCHVDEKKFQGFAFGMGVERLIMLKYGISYIRQLYNSDERWLNILGKKFYD